MADTLYQFSIHLQEIDLTDSQQAFENVLVTCSSSGNVRQEIKNVSKASDFKYIFYFNYTFQAYNGGDFVMDVLVPASLQDNRMTYSSFG